MNADGQITKAEADYGKSSAPACHRCGICSQYVQLVSIVCPTTMGTGTCKVVEGSIEPMYGCKLFDKDLILAANDPLFKT